MHFANNLFGKLYYQKKFSGHKSKTSNFRYESKEKVSQANGSGNVGTGTDITNGDGHAPTVSNGTGMSLASGMMEDVDVDNDTSFQEESKEADEGV